MVQQVLQIRAYCYSSQGRMQKHVSAHNEAIASSGSGDSAKWMKGKHRRVTPLSGLELISAVTHGRSRWPNFIPDVQSNTSILRFTLSYISFTPYFAAAAPCPKQRSDPVGPCTKRETQVSVPAACVKTSSNDVNSLGP